MVEVVVVVVVVKVVVVEVVVVTVVEGYPPSLSMGASKGVSGNAAPASCQPV